MGPFLGISLHLADKKQDRDRNIRKKLKMGDRKGDSVHLRDVFIHLPEAMEDS